jgi:4-hydroxy-2,2'-bipyrrole-5-carbaldehyde O-methyltransferase
MSLRYLISVWRTIRIPGLLPFMRDWIPFLRMNFLYAAFTSGLFQALSTGATRESLVQTLNVQRPELLDALLDMGTALSELSCRDGIYRLKGKRSRTMATPQGDVLAAIVEANVTYYSEAYRRLADRMRGAPLGDDLSEIGEVVARFSKIGEPILDQFIKSLVGGSKPVRILDVGCGSGFVLKTARQANRLAKGIGIDCDAMVVAQARGNLAQWGLSDAFHILEGDIRALAETSAEPFDVITAFNLIYYFPQEERASLFRLMHALLSANGCLALANNFKSKGRDTAAANLNIINTSLNHLTALPGLTATKTLLAECGFTRIRVTRFMPRSEFFGIIASV